MQAEVEGRELADGGGIRVVVRLGLLRFLRLLLGAEARDAGGWTQECDVSFRAGMLVGGLRGKRPGYDGGLALCEWLDWRR